MKGRVSGRKRRYQGKEMRSGLRVGLAASLRESVNQPGAKVLRVRSSDRRSQSHRKILNRPGSVVPRFTGCSHSTVEEKKQTDEGRKSDMHAVEPNEGRATQIPSSPEKFGDEASDPGQG